MEAPVYTFLLVATLGIIFFAIFFENLQKYLLKENRRKKINRNISVYMYIYIQTFI
ncbi:hypothetical protein KP509_19G038600 [Ceratopteris richardii]|uniref:Photosystem II reaction center protein T n=1 Tax=Ceratopteris richardii TaxID=49495 RepID=A0A8T2SN61_CERRI|nr:hypothetical protein KP509_19G038600 [Ceratopteris richardii]